MASVTRDERARPAAAPAPEQGPPEPPPIHPSFIQVAKPYIFEHTIQQCFEAMRVDPIREASMRLQGIALIDSVRRILHLPLRTFNTAAVYYHRFRLVTPDTGHNFMVRETYPNPMTGVRSQQEILIQDAAAAALFTACKIEDTLKKSREIACAVYNLKKPSSEHLSPDDEYFETNAARMMGLERLMLEASGFDFRNRQPTKRLLKLGKHFQVGDDVALLAYRISIDLYRTYAPLKQTSSTMAFACLELACRLADLRNEPIETGQEYERWGTSRAEVMETLFDLLEMYTHQRGTTSVGPDFRADRFLTVRIPLNQEAAAQNLPRYTREEDSENRSTETGEGAPSQRPPHPLTPVAANNDRLGDRADRGARDAPVRFMIDPEWAAAERQAVEPYFREEWEEYEVEV
ncbi:cyclin [Penicillium argentinense]|uniref:Cyclin n=1 Tax=Penicillium argentinense TaxID=1131581 RepID=A0A9W9EYH3_9EURO|nr:cyclin [Penicillium argentinense]KAJ5090333.1 cyclin [Penicillium argentinense]